jgi:hypothetical protein
MDEYKKYSKVQPEECRDKDTYFNDMIAWQKKIEGETAAKMKQK